MHFRSRITGKTVSSLSHGLTILKRKLTFIDFNEPTGSWSGFINASYSLGAILSLPVVPILNDRFGRRKAIFIGSWVMVAGAIVQCFAQNGTLREIHACHEC